MTSYRIIEKDPYFPSPRIFKLTGANFHYVIKNTDAVMVLFYMDPQEKGFRKLSKVISEAACSTKRESHAYASVNCFFNEDLCRANNITDIPVLKLFYQGSAKATMTDFKNTTPELLRRLVELI